MKKLMAVIACGLLVGCDYTVPLAKTPEMEIDARLVGLWQRTIENEQTQSLLVLPLSAKEYMVSIPSGSEKALFARACLCRTNGRTLVQLEWIGTSQGEIPDNNRVFQFAEYTVSGETLTVRMLNADVVKRDVTSTGELAANFAENREKPNLFKDELVFTKFAR